jgi:hypothetical protein
MLKWFLPLCLLVAAESAEEPPADQAIPELVPLKIELPERFPGCALSYWSPALEALTFDERRPYFVPSGTQLLSRGKHVTSSAGQPILGTLEQITDGDKHYQKNSLVILKEGLQWVQVDLEESHAIFAVVVWHFHEGSNVYFDVIVQLSDDPEFKEGITTIYNNDFDNSAEMGKGDDKEYVDTYEGRLMPVEGVKVRYVRLYSQGNTINDQNHYVEVEVFGRPAAE